MKIVFFGTPKFVVPVLSQLHKEFRGHDGGSPIAAVVTQEPKPAGRKKELAYSAVDDWAHKHKVPKYFDAEKLIEEGVGADVGVLAAYGKIISKSVIGHFPKGILNVHPSLLPQFRGASPIQATIATGAQAGLSIMKMDEKLDHGPIVTAFKDEVMPNDTAGSLTERLFERSAEVIAEMLPAYMEGKIKLKPQDHSAATFTRLIKRDDAFVPWEIIAPCLQGDSPQAQTWEIPFIKNYNLSPTSYNLDRFIRAMHPWPGVWTLVKQGNQEKRLKILKARVEEGKLVLEKVQLEGKEAVSWEQFTQSYPV